MIATPGTRTDFDVPNPFNGDESRLTLLEVLKVLGVCKLTLDVWYDRACDTPKAVERHSIYAGIIPTCQSRPNASFLGDDWLQVPLTALQYMKVIKAASYHLTTHEDCV